MKKRTFESIVIETAPSGTVFWTSATDRQITALASAYKRKVSTERKIAFSPNTQAPEPEQVSKVTIL